MFAGNDASGLDGFAEAAEAGVVVGLEDFFHPVDAVGLHHLGHFDGVAFGPGHPAIEHDVAVGAEGLACALDEIEVLTHAIAAIGGAVGDGEL